ncbi:hypothetical protein [Mucilaginibacter sp. AK015]|uniref:hypothetical protein n=1 Tax=Mucilaginibacter sp. AK015 TaxID=2723072 RepID=UPI001620C3A6|nr:hypothetical protein [Mucilaginibacter sp. AK015]MBB5395633.1 hypothetical protein [Mucilaginibacter sp. AK015]
MKKYILKPGTHQFAPGSPAVHNNDNLTDKEAEWYLQRYPHIVKLFTAQSPEAGASEVKEEKTKMKRRRIKRAEFLAPPSGGEEGL